ncbi:uncharacterized protein LOC131844252 [Achroia grisella]|uniref:uncharacterized protein LOC131844252 n=1 Tax=Achroia grisella TaxID=688607 RepID=UPI0027D21836|nr:uncharacterized protein LOC131844252 [Achroia grisella]
MYRIVALFVNLYAVVNCANYQRYGETTSRYPSYTTISNLYNQYPSYKSNYNSDIANFPEATRYPNYSPTYTTNSYNAYSNSGGYYNKPLYTTPRYGMDYGQRYGEEYNGGYSSYEEPFMKGIRDYCVNRSPQTGILDTGLMGMWYGVEYIQHLAGDARVDSTRTCIVIHISEPMDRPSTENQLFHVQHINAKFRQQFRHLRLLWDEAGQTTEYSLYFRNESAGYWQVFDGQNGTMANNPRYQQFSGTVQVLKAVNDHLVLNFCQEPKNGRTAQLYSVLFSRDPGIMARWELDSVHTLLQNKKLSVASRRMVCGNSAVKPVYSIVLSLTLMIFPYIFCSS